MKRLTLSRTLCLVAFASAVAMAPALAGEAVAPTPTPAPAPTPRPGLEIFDGAAPIGQSRYPGQELPTPPRTEGEREDFLADPIFSQPTQQPPYRAPDMRRTPVSPARPPADEGADGQTGGDPFNDPFAGLGGEIDEFAPAPLPPMGSDPYDPNYQQDPYYPQDPYAQQDPYYQGAAPQAPFPQADPYSAPAPRPPAADPLVAAPYQPPSPAETTIEALNTSNPYFPGLREAVQQGDLNAAGASVWDTVKRRRVVDATMSRGPGGSWGSSNPYEVQRLMDAINQNPQGAEDPLRAASRINAILDAFTQPLIEDPTIGMAMPAMLVRLHDDTNRVRHALALYNDEGVFLELSRTYVRAITTCDFFGHSRKSFALDIRDIMDRGVTMFYPDGSSRGGDVAGVTGNLFQILLMMEYYTRDDSWFRRDISSMWKAMEKPARYVLDVACPDWSLPAYGPRGSREMTPTEITALNESFPKPPANVTRIGLGSTKSFPSTSNKDSYGGIYVLRDNSGDNGRYMSVKFGPRGDLLNVPSHNDFGSMVLASRGVKYMIDAGGYGGASASGAAHGGVSLDGRHVTENSYHVPGTLADAIWRTNASMDYLTDQAAFEDGKSWQRSVLYIKNLPGETRSDYWVVLDHVNMQGDPQPKNAVVRFQMAPGLQVYNDGSGVFASSLAGSGAGLRMFAVDAGANIQVTDGGWGDNPGQVFDASGGSLGAPSVSVSRQLTGDSTTTTLLYPADDYSHRPVRIERDADIIRGRTGAVVVDHGMDKIDVIAWASPGTELVTPTLNLQLSADMAVFRIRRGKIARIDFINLERFQAKEPDGGMWSMRVNGPAQSLVVEPAAGGAWQVYADTANRGAANFFDVNFGPTISRRKFSIRPGEFRVITR